MKRILRGLRRKAVDALNLDMMSEKYQVLVANYVLFMAYTTLESVFVNTLLYTVMDDIRIVIYYRFIVYFSMAVMMHPAAYLGQKKSPTAVIKTGAALYMCMYLLLFFGMGRLEVTMIPIGILSGCGSAFYWSGHTQLVPHYTAKSNRDLGIAILGIVQGAMTLCVPVVAGFVIKLMHGSTGYRAMFGIGMLAVAGQLLVQGRLVAVEQKKHVSKAKLAFRLLRKKRSYQLMVGYELIRGFRDGAFAFLPNMVLFEIITDEALVGVNTFLTGAAAITGAWVYGRVVRPHMRGRVAIAAAAVLTLCCLPLFLLMNPVTVMGFSLLSSFFTLFHANCCSNSTYDVMGQNETTRSCMGETVAIREGALGTGRLCGLAILLMVPHNLRGYATAILFLTVIQFLCGLLILLTQRTMNRKTERKPIPLGGHV